MNMRDHHSEIKTDRRGFIKGVGGALLTVQSLSSMAHASGGVPSAASLAIRSGHGFVPHTHELLIPYAVLHVPPPRGVKLLSTSALFHAHDVVLTKQQLTVVNQGGTVIVTGGSHTFVIALAHAIRD